MFIHSVYFWLKPEITADQEKLFIERVNALTKIASAKQGFVGKPADTDRPVIDRTYSYGLVTVFDDKAGHDFYQVDPIHTKFTELRDLWTRIQIYDFE